jgi:7,8-dihydroneopterin 2',3'-cyclic phosphate phosphodiesterase
VATLRKISPLEQVIGRIRNKDLRRKVAEVVRNPQIQIGGAVHTGIPLEASPAGLYRHHSYPGGLVEHIAASAKIALAFCDVVEEVYGGKVDRDLVLAGIILHDIFKPFTYEVNDDSYLTTYLGERLDHLTLAAAELVRRDFPLDLIHLVCAHHGGQAGPIWPKTIEALICHLTDQADSQLNGQVLRAARYLSRRVIGEEPSQLTSKEAFEVVHSKAVEGWKGARKTLEKIRRRRRNSN